MGSSLVFLNPILHLLPEVAPPSRPLQIREKLVWAGLALAFFFIMYNVSAVGVKPNVNNSDFLQVVTAISQAQK
ncbi:MAG: hypothetical protein NT051_04635 [Candidatus Micrarchaeota archaeon]|nr:hypothetical protein [Candidatus Micrarchaeota archaeon]